MDDLFDQTLKVCEHAFFALERKVAPPRRVPQGPSFVFRSADRTLEQAVVQKLSRVISGLHATRALLCQGLYQEVGVLFRVLDELSEDVVFLCQPLRGGNITPLHQEYLETFYQEEFDDPENPMASTQLRPTISRKRIHAALAAIPDSPLNPSDAHEVHRTISKTFSGYVHAASVHIMDSYGGDPPRYHVAGMLGTPRQKGIEKQALHYFYRGLASVMYAATCMKEIDLVKELYAFRDHFEQQVNMTDWPDPDKFVRKVRRGEV
jgi:hypothetical protein